MKSFWCESRWAAYAVGQQSSESSSVVPSCVHRPFQCQEWSLKMSYLIQTILLGALLRQVPQMRQILQLNTRG
jgi:hypothetical protein